MSLPGWLDPLYEAGEMRAVDAWAIEERGVPSLDLMERAGRGAGAGDAAAAAGDPVRVVVGKGNNGGDGLVVARLLREEGREVDVLADGPARRAARRRPGEPRPAARATARAVRRRARWTGSGAVVDAMLGTGFEGEPREPVAGAIAAINAQDAPVVACDVPSGVNASTGEIEGEAVGRPRRPPSTRRRSACTWRPAPSTPAWSRSSRSASRAARPAPQTAGLITERVLELFPRRAREGSKFTSGVVVVAGGVEGADRRARDGRARRRAGRRRLRAGRGARRPRSRRSTCGCSRR